MCEYAMENPEKCLNKLFLSLSQTLKTKTDEERERTRTNGPWIKVFLHHIIAQCVFNSEWLIMITGSCQSVRHNIEVNTFYSYPMAPYQNNLSAIKSIRMNAILMRHLTLHVHEINDHQRNITQGLCMQANKLTELERRNKNRQ